jgi:hypothetical protein
MQDPAADRVPDKGTGTEPANGALQPHAASFRDNAGHVFVHEGVFLRRVHPSYLPTYRLLKSSGFFDRLWANGWLIPHAELPPGTAGTNDLILRPEQIQTITYPYEWSFGQWRDAALLTLRIQRAALQAGFSLKDASAFNVQHHQGRPVLIDTLSFEEYAPHQPWQAYRQFCQHFLAPLALMARRDPRLGLLARNYIDGIPLDLASRLLPRRTWLRPGLLIHLHLHARMQTRYQNRDARVKPRPISRQGLLGIVESLESLLLSLRWEPAGTEWADYYQNTNYTETSARDKESVIGAWLGQTRPSLVWDLGANDGRFSRLACAQGAATVAWDIDPAAVELCYRRVVREHSTNLLPALLDLTNPTPALGWNLQERLSLFERRRPDLVMALALLHHLAIGNNVPLDRCADFFRRLGDTLIIEWVPKTDSKAQALLRNRRDIFADYTETGFQGAFTRHYRILERHAVADSERVLYLLQRSA